MRKRLIGVACLLVVLAFALGGCVFSDTITEKIYDDLETSTIDPDLPPKLVNTPNATITTDVLPRLDFDDSSPESDTEESLPLYTGDYDKASTQAEASKPEYQQGAANMGEAGTDPAEQADDAEQAEPKPTGDDQGDEEPDDDPPDFGDDTDDDVGHKSGGTGDVYHNDGGEPPAIPEGIDEVAAIGNYAVIVSMISGTENKSSLVACDKDTKDKASGLLANRGIGKAQALWSGDGTAAGSISDENFGILITDVVPDLVFVPEGSSMLTEDQKAALQERSIDVYYLPELTSASRITATFEIVGKILAKGGVEGAEENYRAYLDYHSAQVEKYRSANGGFGGGYDFDAGADAAAASATRVTLYLDYWDEGARYSDSSGIVTSPNGVGVATLGYAASPVTYYLSVGGVLNNAASKIVRKHVADDPSKTGLVWQFAQNELSYGFDRWSGLRVSNYDLWASEKGSTYGSDLLWYTSVGVTGYGLGTSGFPAVVCKNSSIANNLEAAAAKAGQLYFPYPTIKPTGKGSTVGYFIDAAEEHYVESCIGNDGSGVASGLGFGVFVNPKGLSQGDSDDPLCSWCAGSPESILESSWAYWRFCGGSEADFDAEVRNFYSTFYGYELADSELSAMKAGAGE